MTSCFNIQSATADWVKRVNGSIVVKGSIFITCCFLMPEIVWIVLNDSLTHKGVYIMGSYV